MRVGLFQSYVTDSDALRAALALAQEAESAGLERVWVAEAYGSDAVTVLAAVAARTSRIGIGSAVLQIPARTPAATVMTAATLDALSGGRFSLGLGVSGPQVSEGWHGVRFADPLGRTREYLELVRRGLARQRLTGPGPHLPLPLPDGPGKPLVLAFDPVRKAVPIYLAALGPKNLALTAGVADGWLGIFVDPEQEDGPLATLRAAVAAAGREPGAVDVALSVPVAVHPDPQRAADRVRAHAALYLGGMGSRESNFYHRTATRMGFGRQANEVQEKYMARDYAGAAAAVPFDFLDATCLLGDEQRLAERLGRYARAEVDAVNVSVFAAGLDARIGTLHTVMAAARRAGVAA